MSDTEVGRSTKGTKLGLAADPAKRQKTSGAFKDLQRLCARLENENSHLKKTEFISEFLQSFTGDLYLLFKQLLPKHCDKRVFNVGDKRLREIFARYLGCSSADMKAELESSGEISSIVSKFFAKSNPKQKTSILTLSDVDEALDRLAGVTTDSDMDHAWKRILDRCTPDDAKFIVRITQKDMRFGMGPSNALPALHPDAYEAFKQCQDLQAIVDRYSSSSSSSSSSANGTSSGAKAVSGKGKGVPSLTLTLFTPIKPMLAEACKDLKKAITNCKTGLFSEVKYDGERIQIHKDGSNFKYFSRQLKPVMRHKVEDVEKFIIKAVSAQNCVLDGELILVNEVTGALLPFGTLGKHKKKTQQDGVHCVFIFDIMYCEGKSVMHETLQSRRDILNKVVRPIKNHVQLSEAVLCTTLPDVQAMMDRALKDNLEGLVMKDIQGKYEPNARHWLKIKKDYLDGMADSADLVVLGGYYGTGSKGGLLSVFLMGCYDSSAGKWKTVCKVGNGHDDAMINRLQTELKMKRIDCDYSRVPSWLSVSRSQVPNFVSEDPKKSPVWEVIGASFSHSDNHTSGLSIRFPRIKQIRSDKDWKSATSLAELKVLVAASAGTSSHDAATGMKDEEDEEKDGGDEQEAAQEEGEAEATWEARSDDDNEDDENAETEDEEAAQITTNGSHHGNATTTPSSSSLHPPRSSPSHPSSPLKRSAPDSPSSSVSSKRPSPSPQTSPPRSSSSPPPGVIPCKYGTACYRKNADHLKQFWHPAK
mmetsp:Transcript_8130/g.13154  ORF Transcript_8130/g.13154 Transcript_8130/m.13154 type:complete len:760 (+) Transcript_8130:62-2341(+)|eukprot:CAMPEP_0184339954 /NCGR_PEP_ID=MMETSP1089-20130417/8631_1 /TAXON_ID=38269 ORGANISM="Gloeochaete wittrockiana, Strain SAG46.84" /NCGR_SAMPLE_ID=MMETSP1089 /ASSEMBLY_ACC=CAM_ASM_000445 /LENGTH=759 /DNA_ID=CAMNT_0026667503 /DNA_START=30 /DNA_END=2309 /DNA_ORIENTATION=+